MADNTSDTQTSGRSVFITGASEGVGLALLKALVKRGHKVTGTTTSSAGAARIRRNGGLPASIALNQVGEVRSLLQMAQAEVIVHLAASFINEAPQYKADDAAAIHALESTDEIVVAAGQAGAKRIILGSFAFLYGDTHGNAVDESAPLSRNADLYKSAAHAEAAVLDGGIPGYVVRSGINYGGNSSNLQALHTHLVQNGGVVAGSHSTSWVQEDDLAAALVLLVEHSGEGEALANVYNVADDSLISPDGFIAEFGDAVGVGAPSKYPVFIAPLFTSASQRAILETSVKVNSSKIRALGWQPEHTNRAQSLDRALSQWRAQAAGDDAPVVLPERAIVTL